jgi:hypothetical protein
MRGLVLEGILWEMLFRGQEKGILGRKREKKKAWSEDQNGEAARAWAGQRIQVSLWWLCLRHRKWVIYSHHKYVYINVYIYIYIKHPCRHVERHTHAHIFHVCILVHFTITWRVCYMHFLPWIKKYFHFCSLWVQMVYYTSLHLHHQT